MVGGGGVESFPRQTQLLLYLIKLWLSLGTMKLNHMLSNLVVDRQSKTLGISLLSNTFPSIL